MTDIRKQLSAFIGSERERFANRHNNMFAFGFSQLIRYHEFLALVVERYKRASEDFVANTRELQSTIKRGTHEGLSNRFSVIFFRACREELLHLCFPAGQVQVLPAG